MGYGEYNPTRLGGGRGGGHFNGGNHTSGAGHWNDGASGGGSGVDYGYGDPNGNGYGYGQVMSPIVLPGFVTHTDDVRGAAIEAVLNEVTP